MTQIPKTEMWKNHPIYSNYLVRTNGDVSHKSKFSCRKPRLDRYGYRRINISHGGKHISVLIYRLVAETFLPDQTGKTVNHKDGNKLNDALENLEYVSGRENTQHAFRSGLIGTCHAVEIDGVKFYSKREAERITGLDRQLMT